MIRLEISAHMDFNIAVDLVSECVGASGGWLLSHQFYSNVMAAFAVFCPPAGVTLLQQALESRGFALHQPVPAPQSDAAEVPIQIALTVVHDGPDFRRPVPAFG